MPFFFLSIDVLFNCDFEVDLCNMKNDPRAGVSGSKRYEWLLNSGQTPSSGTGPSTGEGGKGQYVFFETSDPVEAYEGMARWEYVVIYAFWF